MPQTPAPVQYGNWVDVTVGTDMPFNSRMAAYVSLAQADNTLTGEEYMYTLGLSAHF